jgi:hypothetical protein
MSTRQIPPEALQDSCMSATVGLVLVIGGTDTGGRS